MTDCFSHGDWTVKEGHEAEFEGAWKEFVAWGMQRPGGGTARLVRDLDKPGHYVSFAPWDSVDAMHGWKSAPEFREKMGAVQEHVAEFTPLELELGAEV